MQTVFLVYVPRSGSTLLANRLQKTIDGVISLPEVGVIERLIVSGDEVVRNLSDDRLRQIFLRDPQFTSYRYWLDRLDEIIDASQKGGVAATIETMCKLHMAAGGLVGDTIIVKKGSLLKSIHAVRSTFKGPLFIHLHRDPRAVVRSMVEAKDPHYRNRSFARGDIWHAAKYFDSCIRYLHDNHVHDPDLVTISFESYLQRQDATIHQIADFLGKPLRESDGASVAISSKESALHRRYDGDIDLERLQSWKNSLSVTQICLIELLTRRSMEKLGYQPSVSSQFSRLGKLKVILRGYLQYLFNSGKHLLRRSLFQ